ncbi:MAG: FkbM family methyltransferase [Terriglobales bacterium]
MGVQASPPGAYSRFRTPPGNICEAGYNLRANHLGARVQAVHAAFAAQSGTRAISRERDSQQRSLIPADLSAPNGNGIPVAALTLTDLIEQYNLPQIDLLKMDIEGSEWEVLHSTPESTLHRIRRIQFEYHEVHARFGYSRKALFDYLQSTGYALTHCEEDREHTGIAILERPRQSAVSRVA